jgi:surface antigen
MGPFQILMERKMGSKTVVASVLAVSMLVLGCATQGQKPSQNETTGAVAGSALGSALGFVIPYGGGALLGLAGGYAGARIGSYLDEKEKREMAEASVRAAADAKTGERVAWGASNSIGQPTSATEQSSASETTTPTSASTSTIKKPPKTAKSTKTKPTSESGGATSGSAVKTAGADANAASGYVVPMGDFYYTKNGQKCRDLQEVANKGGKTYQQKVQACQGGSGWVVPQA